MALLLEDPAPTGLSCTGNTPGMTTRGSGACRAGLRGGATTDKQVVKSCLSMITELEERTGADQTWV
jgi:hypothetical protein